ncbi:hypothetical protein DNU06_04710 [Putridiphycobacter roseus]|uniref:Uncharacterized protein n=1 Tax=Putridiphycobacter roseus TaxID=2219161 RepID=A0A2W1NFN3_9FLAO|nr:T9SS type A sorting domain-containing protein [Putridiphycobacter roseus]PZE17923.1 hypothetical protein DNU06_04710 [Putridiphycobacter roseus]
MKKFILLFALYFSFTMFAQQNNGSVTVGSETRSYIEYIPQNYQNSESAPLVIILHGIGGTAQEIADAGLNFIADTARFIPLYLQGENNAFGSASWNNNTLLASTVNDIAFFQTMIEKMVDDYNIDRSRVYFVGISMGAIMTFTALNSMDGQIAAAVCHIGTMSDIDLAAYNPSIPRPVMQVHGTADAVVPYAGTALPSLSLVNPTINKLKTINGWNGTDSTIIDIPDIMADGITIERIIYDCTTPLEHWKMNGADHIFLIPGVNDTSGAVITWNFLAQYNHPNPTLGLSKTITEKPLNVFPNPVQNILNIPISAGNVALYNLNQQLIQTYTISEQQIDLRDIPVGTYFLKITADDGTIQHTLITKE